MSTIFGTSIGVLLGGAYGLHLMATSRDHERMIGVYPFCYAALGGLVGGMAGLSVDMFFLGVASGKAMRV